MTKQETDRRTSADTLIDRRRPGRREVDPALIPLLRGRVRLDQFATVERLQRRDDLGTAVGLTYGLAISAVLWAAIAYAWTLVR